MKPDRVIFRGHSRLNIRFEASEGKFSSRTISFEKCSWGTRLKICSEVCVNPMNVEKF